ncbi:MAG: serpin family protein [Methanoregula sp.]|nr:serpin family protein [Methanoregula sp.]
MDNRILFGCVGSALVILCIFGAGCTGTTPAQPVTPPVENTPQTSAPTPAAAVDQIATREVAGASNQFAFDLYSKIQKSENEDRNIFFSPFSISSALAITYEGAKGKTADEIRSVFHFPSDTATLRKGYAGLDAIINSGDAAYSLRTANALWAEKTYPFLSEYTGTAEQYYGAKTTNLDFIGQPEASRITINQWVEEQTNDKIKDLLPAGTIDPITRLVITNAIYFKGTWVKQFDTERTSDEDFRTASGKTVRVPMMQRTDEDAVYRYVENDDLQLLAMPYEHASGRELSMAVLLPKEDSLAPLEASLGTETFSDLQQSATSRRVMVYFPKFTLKTKYERMAETLAAMGMPTAFTANADFSGMDGKSNLLISDVIHQAYVDVNEEGTEAAAATAVVMKLAAAPMEPEPIPVFRADHPFIFFIQDNETGAILFMGQVTDPTDS